LIVALWACFCIRALFYCTVMPVWEGYDEHSHFAYVHHLTTEHELPSPRTATASEIEQSVQSVAVSFHLRDQLRGAGISHDDYWSVASRPLPRDTVGLRIYEAQQPPVYYALLAAPYSAASGLGVIERVWLLRLLSVLLASMVIPLTWLLARMIFDGEALAIGSACVAASMPELYINISRISNEVLAVAAGSVMLLLTVAAIKHGLTTRLACVLGFALGASLLTKAYFLSVAAAVILCLARLAWRKAVIAALIAAAVAGWWYVRTFMRTGSLSGEQADAAVQQIGASGILAAIPQIDWRHALDSTFVSHIWFGGWSFLTVRSWMYQAFALIFIAAAIGLVRSRRVPGVQAIAFIYASLVAALAYHVLVNFIVHGKPVTTGWYLYALVAGEAILLVRGLAGITALPWRMYAPAAIVCSFAALELFATHVYLLPYYTGFTRHVASGGLPALQLSQLANGGLGELITRLSANKPFWITPGVIGVLWIAYLTAIASTIALSLPRGRKNLQSAPLPRR
jgi:hypothetical protein